MECQESPHSLIDTMDFVLSRADLPTATAYTEVDEEQLVGVEVRETDPDMMAAQKGEDDTERLGSLRGESEAG